MDLLLLPDATKTWVSTRNTSSVTSNTHDTMLMEHSRMEPVTHFLSGAILSRAGFNRRTAYATLAMTLAAETPDLDVLWYIRGPVAGFQHHRGITHTFLGAPFEALVVTAVMWAIHQLRKKKPTHPGLPPPRWALLWLFSLFAILLHILLDYTNNYGIRPFFPFNPHWYAWSTVFIVDPILLLVLAAALILPALFGLADREIGARRELFRGRGWAIAALVVIALYYGLRNAEHAHAIRTVESARVGIDSAATPSRVSAEPYPISPFHWHAIVETPDYFQTAEVSTWNDLITTSDLNDRIDKPPVTPALAAAKQSWLGRVYLGWAQFPVTRDTGRELPPDADPASPNVLERVDFEDLRFAYSAIPGSNEGRPPLSASVYVAPDGQIEAMYMGETLQK
jgi:inner membrane protein